VTTADLPRLLKASSHQLDLLLGQHLYGMAEITPLQRVRSRNQTLPSPYLHAECMRFLRLEDTRGKLDARQLLDWTGYYEADGKYHCPTYVPPMIATSSGMGVVEWLFRPGISPWICSPRPTVPGEAPEINLTLLRADPASPIVMTGTPGRCVAITLLLHPVLPTDNGPDLTKPANG